MADEKNETLFLPGDVAFQLEKGSTTRIRGGLMRSSNVVIATRPGPLFTEHSPKGPISCVESTYNRYIPKLEDPVIGIVTRRNAENYTIDIGSVHSAILPALAFDGASKRIHPNLTVGSIIFARVTGASKDLDPELSCASSTLLYKKDWVTDLGIFGELKGGYIFKVSSATIRRLIDPNCHVTTTLGKYFPFEIAVGKNALVWVKTSQTVNTVIVANVIQRSDTLAKQELEALVAQASASVGARTTSTQ